MNVNLTHFNNFKTTLKNTYDFDEPERSFVGFLIDIKDVYFDLKDDILLYSIELEDNVYSKFSELIIHELSSLKIYLKDKKYDNDKNYKNIETIKPWIEKYNFKYEGIESILNIANYPELYEEEGIPLIYDDLAEIGMSSSPESIYAELGKLQHDFLNFTKANLIDDIIYLLNMGNVNKTNIENSVKWEGTPTELTALIKALIESNVFNSSLSEKEIRKRFEHFFEYEIRNYDQNKSKIRKRINDFTPFIDKLKTNLEKWIKKED